MEDLRGFCRDPSVEDARVADTLIADKVQHEGVYLPDLVRGCMLLEIPFDRDMARHREWSHDELEERIEDALRVVVMERGFSTPYAGGKKKDPVECIDLTFEDIAGGKRKRTAGDNESKVLRVFLSKLTNGLRLGMDEEKKSKQVKKQSKKQDGGFCTTAQFRRRLTKAGLRLLPDQDVLHIIASSNGGADHVDNYHWLGNRVLDIQMGNKTDHIYCYLAGQVMARAAVKISKKHGKQDRHEVPRGRRR
ncbi:uncharacterized protein EV422DRAFT_216158 [Fimicolochytrium jonesii]|uniref:uncharacterized protein n=1 Tax=Fimicolochytrium jonesii TaxID=1396493 RepID=UPI0022FDDAC8|nr:uncharacterized protein EV422DRAFT_216158 [Fimicolochytrium jonesii]KAI8817515.1 hypothetical protein EV422DRAFT_216158 [Fimicolochytrium jonesii]